MILLDLGSMDTLQKCLVCLKNKPMSGFSVELGKRRRTCRDCRNNRQMERLKNPGLPKWPRHGVPNWDPTSPVKACCACMETKPKSEFYRHRNRADGFQTQCKPCADKYTSEHAKRIRANPEKRKKHNRRSLSLLHHCDIDALWREQCGLCKLCGGPMIEDGRKPDSACVDHDHICCPGPWSCGKCVRGLIHHSCNLMIGLAGEDPVKLERGAVYLRKFGKT